MRRVTSITRRLHHTFIQRKMGIYIGADLLLIVCVSLAYLAGLEYSALGTFAAKAGRWIGNEEQTSGIFYYVADRETGKILLSSRLDEPLVFAVVFFVVLFILQLISVLTKYAKEDRKIREILDPLNELALRADELSRMSFSEDKYQLLEDAITKIRPDDTEKLSFGDSDLMGVEAAMNNLLLRMQETYRQQARFVNDASHELRTPIAVIQGYANMLDRWGKRDEKILDESIAAIRNESEHMNHLVEQLLFLARGDSGKTAVKRERIDLGEMMREVYEESFLIDERHLYRFQMDGAGSAAAGGDSAAGSGPAADKLFVTVDQGLLKQAVRILIDNAAKYTRDGDEILLSCGLTEAREPYVQVQDLGIGMAEADVQHMFERFYRSDDARSYQGTGLGLSIAKWIVDKHRGHFEILSRTGLGTRIRIVLPAS